MPQAAEQVVESLPVPKLAKVENVDIFSTGLHRGERYGREFVTTAAENFYKLKDRLTPTLCLGHEENQELLDNTGIPSVGVITDLWTDDRPCSNCKETGKVDGQVCPACDGTKICTYMVADFGDVNPEIAKLINQRAFRTCSSEMYSDFEDQGQHFGPACRRCALLGGEIPQIKNLDDLPFATFADKSPNQPTVVLYCDGPDCSAKGCTPRRRSFKGPDGLMYFTGMYRPATCHCEPKKFCGGAGGKPGPCSTGAQKTHAQKNLQRGRIAVKQAVRDVKPAAKAVAGAAKTLAKHGIAAAKASRTGKAVGRIAQAGQEKGKLAAVKQTALEGGKAVGDMATRALTLGWSPALYKQISDKHGHVPAVLGTGAAAMARTAALPLHLAAAASGIPGVGLVKNKVADAIGHGVGWAAGKGSAKGVARTVGAVAGASAAKGAYKMIRKPERYIPGLAQAKSVAGHVANTLGNLKARLGLHSERAYDILADRVVRVLMDADNGIRRFSDVDLRPHALQFIRLCESMAVAK